MGIRTIIFRGKRKDNGEWVYGDFMHGNERKSLRDSIFVCDSETQSFNDYEIDSSTIGQYTGLTDKNGKKIFEGDIVKTQPFYDRPYSDKRKSKEFIGVVKYKTKIFNGNKYHSKQCYHGEWGLKFYEDFGKYTHYSWGELWNCEVIGNTHDNPELLKGDKDNG